MIFPRCLEEVAVDDGCVYLQFRSRINFIACISHVEKETNLRCEGMTYVRPDDRNPHVFFNKPISFLVCPMNTSNIRINE